MPFYSFYNEKTKKTIDLIMSIHDNHEFIDNDGYKWIRIWYKPQASFNTKIDPFSSKDFSNKVGLKKGSYGDVLDYSKEYSERREALAGKDDIKENYYMNYAKKRRGKLHKDIKQRICKEKLDKSGVILED